MIGLWSAPSLHWLASGLPVLWLIIGVGGVAAAAKRRPPSPTTQRRIPLVTGMAHIIDLVRVCLNLMRSLVNQQWQILENTLQYLTFWPQYHHLTKLPPPYNDVVINNYWWIFTSRKGIEKRAISTKTISKNS
jgi:hypothetical protein